MSQVAKANIKDHVKVYLKDLEFRIPVPAAKLAVPFAGLANPFRAQEHELKCLFIHVPKAAGTSVAKAIFGEKSRHIPLSRYFVFDDRAAREYFKFAFVRNPWDRFFSAYHYLARRIGADPAYPDHRWATRYLGGKQNFGNFVKRMAVDRRYRFAVRRYIHFRPQVDWISIPGRQGVGMDFVGRFEDMENDFQRVCARIGVSAALPHERKGTGVNNYREAFDFEGRQLVAELYRRDIEAFGYTFDA